MNSALLYRFYTYSACYGKIQDKYPAPVYTLLPAKRRSAPRQMLIAAGWAGVSSIRGMVLYPAKHFNQKTRSGSLIFKDLIFRIIVRIAIIRGEINQIKE